MTKQTSKMLQKRRSDLLQELACLDNIFECETLNTYEKMIEFGINKGFEYICDIGCAYGHQSELCRNRIKYIGIDEDNTNFYNINEFFTTYIAQRYPCSLFAISKEKTMAISVLCLGWNCYKHSEDEFDKQFKALSNDFKASLLYVPVEVKEILEKYFNHVEAIEERGALVHTAMFYCYN